MPSDDAVRPGSARAWAAALRPWSLPIAIAPVLVGAALGWARTGSIDPGIAIAVLAASVLVQLVTNLQNDVGYTVRGAERDGTRTGPPRATARGWLGVRTVRAAVVVASVSAAALGAFLVAARGWPVLAIGVASLTAALAYMGGPRPIAYGPFGEATVLVFFGVVAVCGTDWMLTGGIGPATALASVASGAFAAAALAANNHRDAEHDGRVGRRTFAVRHGPRASATLFAGLLLAPFALLPPIAWAAGSPAMLGPLVLLPSTLRLRRDFGGTQGAMLTPIVRRTFGAALRFAMLLAAGAVLGRLAGV
ncbi:MAG: 1,4-dihydroxy-2-naphthoate octaprenyltransferase [Burkholderiales bacterium]|nr:MAG: 1,4-dihydroxy-2-naphthoate octaprenyltransferase [Burkholderiales bacterium]